MRRGLMAWSREEIAPAVLEQRVAALVSGMRARGLDCVLVYTDLTRPAAVSALTHFIPYWSNGVLVVCPGSGARLVATLSRRVNDWIQSTSRLDDLVNTLDLGKGVAMSLPGPRGAALRVGVVDLASLPSGVSAAIHELHPEAKFEDATDLLGAALAGAGADAIARRCIAIARVALAAGTSAAESRQANAVLAAAEGAARREGAEEILLAMAPDAAIDARLRRIEGGAALGDVFMLQATVAYKGAWVRLGRTLTAGAPRPWITEANAWSEQLVGALAAGAPASALIDSALPRLPGAEVQAWRIETARAGLALAVVDESATPTAQQPLHDSLCTLTLRLRHAEQNWCASTPYIVGRGAGA
ncbi:MAG TPA: hypothetical protein VNN06_09765 [Ramlibacter sp.]|nr:hypothetical protein [Ramlibacter sp.]